MNEYIDHVYIMNIGFNLQSYKCCDILACLLYWERAIVSVLVSHPPGMSDVGAPTGAWAPVGIV